MARGWLSDLLGAIWRVNGEEQIDRRAVNFIAGDGMEISAEDNPATGACDVTFSASGGGGGEEEQDPVEFVYTEPTDYYDDHIVAGTINLASYPWATQIECFLVGGGEGGQSGDTDEGGTGGGSGWVAQGRSRILTPGTGSISVLVGRGGPGGVYSADPPAKGDGGVGGNSIVVSTALEQSFVAGSGGISPLGAGRVVGSGWAPGGVPTPDVSSTAPDTHHPLTMLHAGDQMYRAGANGGGGSTNTDDGGGGAPGQLVTTEFAEAGVTATGQGGGPGQGYGAGGGGGGRDASAPGAGGVGADGYVRVVLLP
jgi:hypothetical protein